MRTLSPDGAASGPPMPEQTVGPAEHARRAHIQNALAEAKRKCQMSGLRLTPARLRVLEILLEEPRALGAYEVLERMKAEGLGAQPPAAYRALDFLITNGFAHRIEGLNAYVACAFPGQPHSPAFVYCGICGKVGETARPLDPDPFGLAAEHEGFHIEATVIEARAVCSECRDKAEANESTLVNGNGQSNGNGNGRTMFSSS